MLTGQPLIDCCAAHPDATGCQGGSSSSSSSSSSGGGLDCSVYTDPTDYANCCAQPGAMNCGSSSSSSSSGAGSSSSSSSSSGAGSSSSSSSSSSGGGSSSSSSSSSGGWGSSSSSSGGQCSSSSSSSSSGGGCCGGCGQCGGTINCGVLGYFTGCPKGGLLTSGGTPLEIAKLLESYANLINAFNGSDGGKAIIAAVAKQIGSMNPGLFIQQSVDISKSQGSQLAALAMLGNSADSDQIQQLVEDAMGSGKINGNLKKVIESLQAKVNSATDPRERAVAAEHLKNALGISQAAEKTMAKVITGPFLDAKGRLLKADGTPVTATDITQAIVDLANANQEYKPADIADGAYED